jgi:hypothetical protein
MVPVAAPRNPAGGVNGAGNLPPAPPFDRATRLSFVRLADIVRPVGGGFSPSVQLPTNGLLAGLHLVIRGTIGGTVGAVSALGMAAIIRRVTLRLNSGSVIWSMTGPNYHYLYRPTIDSGYIDVLGHTNATAAVTATGAILDMIIPLMVNERDPIGLLLLQNRQTTLSLDVEWEADTNVTATGTFAGFAVSPQLLVFSVPPDPRSLPPLRWLHVVTDESLVQGGAGDVTYNVPRGNTYEMVIHGAGLAAAGGADSWSRAVMRVNQTSYIFDFTPNMMDVFYRRQFGRARNPGAIYFDFITTSGLGKYGTTRDLYDSNRTTDFQTVVTVTGALTFYTVREQLIDLDQM